MFVAIASVTGFLTGMENCAPQNPIHIIDFHGTADAIVPYAGNFDANFAFWQVCLISLDGGGCHRCQMGSGQYRASLNGF